MVLTFMGNVLTLMALMLILIRIITDDATDGGTDDDTNDDTDDDTDDGGRGNRRPLPGGAVHFPAPAVPPQGSVCVCVQVSGMG